MEIRLLPVLLLALGLTACASNPTPYQPMDGRDGYTEEQLDSSTWRIQFAGNAETPRQTVEDYLLYRSAEIMRTGGHERFIVLEKEIESAVAYHSFGNLPHPHLFTFRVRRDGSQADHFHHFDKFHFPGHTYALTSYTGYATIRTWTEDQTPSGLRVYDAAEVIRRLGPTIVLPRSVQG